MRVGIVRYLPPKNVRGMPWGRRSWHGSSGGRARKARKPRRAWDPGRGEYPGLANRETASPVGRTRWSAGTKPEGFGGKRRNGKIDPKGSFDHGSGTKLWRAKPLSVESWKRLSRAQAAYAAEGVAKPCGRDFWEVGQRFPDASSLRRATKRVLGSAYAEGQRSSSKVPFFRLLGRQEAAGEAASLGGRRWGGVEVHERWRSVHDKWAGASQVRKPSGWLKADQREGRK